ncbi:MAG: lycopene cyclase domain-containing protein [Schleiferiaceae bacterium]|jgi:lycopene cyclase domain-containing protein|nr:lycopene cyclase domain-containing protein [Schleiferiaceae bacterium]
MSLYFWINLLSISVPFLVSFHPKIKLYKRWAALWPAMILTLIPYIVWDVYFTEHGYWGFNPEYLANIYLFSLPIEEWLFFICIPYACVFTHEAILIINPKIGVSIDTSKKISLGLLILFLAGLILFWNKAYTRVDAIYGMIALGLAYFFNPELLRRFYVTFLFMLIPFFIVNGILTGTGIENEVVWYNNTENLGIRMGTIPVEDTIYAFSMLLFNLFFFQLFQKKRA